MVITSNYLFVQNGEGVVYSWAHPHSTSSEAPIHMQNSDFKQLIHLYTHARLPYPYSKKDGACIIYPKYFGKSSVKVLIETFEAFTTVWHFACLALNKKSGCHVLTFI